MERTSEDRNVKRAGEHIRGPNYFRVQAQIAVNRLTVWYACLDITFQYWPSIPAELSVSAQVLTQLSRTNYPQVCPD